MTLTFMTPSAEATHGIGRRLGEACEPGQLLALSGPLGAGKTVLAQGVGAGLGVAEPISSPTFNLAQAYAGRLPLWHLDVYRLGCRVDLDDLSWEELLAEPGVVLVEWSDRITAALPSDRLDIVLADDGGDVRRLTLTARGERSIALLQRFAEATRGACSRA